MHYVYDKVFLWNIGCFMRCIEDYVYGNRWAMLVDRIKKLTIARNGDTCMLKYIIVLSTVDVSYISDLSAIHIFSHTLHIFVF